MLVPAPLLFQYIERSTSTFFPGVVHRTRIDARPLGRRSAMLKVAREYAASVLWLTIWKLPLAP